MGEVLGAVVVGEDDPGVVVLLGPVTVLGGSGIAPESGTGVGRVAVGGAVVLRCGVVVRLGVCVLFAPGAVVEGAPGAEVLGDVMGAGPGEGEGDGVTAPGEAGGWAVVVVDGVVAPPDGRAVCAMAAPERVRDMASAGIQCLILMIYLV